MFQTDDSWEEANTNLEVLRTLFNQPGLRRHPIVEIVDDVPVLHVDVIFMGEAAELGFWSRFIFRNIAFVVRFLEENEVARSRISIQSSMAQEREYSICAVTKIIAYRDSEGMQFYECEVNNGCTFSEKLESQRLCTTSEAVVVWSAIDDHIRG